MRPSRHLLFIIAALTILFVNAFAQTSGGPDEYGYMWVNSDDANGPAYSWITPPMATDIQGDLSDDNVAGPYDIGFDFIYYGQTYSQVWLSSNGFFTFTENTSSDLSNNPIPDVATPNALVAWFWDDMDPGDNPNGDSHIWLDSVTDNGMDVFLMTFEHYHEYPGGNDGELTCQVALYENGDIKMQYMEFMNEIDMMSNSIGIENEDGTDGLQYQYNTNNLTAEMAIQFYHPIPSDDDMSARAITGPTALEVTTQGTWTITVRNDGLNDQNNFDVKLMDASDDTELASVNVTQTLTNLEELDVDVTWTPTETGMYDLYGKVVLAGDENNLNDTTDQVSCNVTPQGMLEVLVGDPNTTLSDTEYPINVYWWHSLTQVIYYPEDLSNVAGAISQLTWFNTFTEDLPDKVVTVWMGETDMTDLSGGWVPYENFTEVWSGLLDLPIGDNEVTVVFDQPFVYTGGNLVVMVEKNDTQYDSSTNRWYYTDTPEHPNRGREYHADGAANDPDPANPPTGTANSLVPNTRFMINTSGMGSLDGVCYDESNNPLEDVYLTLDTFPGTATSIADGSYEFPFVFVGDYQMTASLHGYYDTVVDNVSIAEDQNTTQDVTLIQLPMVTVTGHVIESDTGNGAPGAVVNMTGYEDYLDITADNNGDFTIPNVYADQTYTMTIDYPGYVSYEGDVVVGNTDLDLGDLMVTEIAIPATGVVAVENDTETAVDLSWNSPGNVMVEEFRYDDGTATAQLGFGANPNAVMGPAFFYDMQVQEVTWLLTSNATHTEAVIYIFGLDETGFPDVTQLLHQSTPQANVDDQWNTYTLPDPVDAPNGCVVGVCTPGVFTAIGTDDGVGEPWVFSEGTMWGIADWTAGTNQWLDVGPAGFPYNFTLRAHGLNYGPIRSYAGNQPVQPKISAREAGLHGGPLKQALTPAAPVWNLADNAQTRLNLTERPVLLDLREHIGYNIYRLPLGDEETPGTWTLLGNNPQTDSTYTDNTWATAATGLYKWAVRAEYTNGVEAPPAFSDWLAKNMYGSLTVNLTTNVGASAAGAQVMISAITPDPDGTYYEYETTADGSAVAFIDDIWMTDYDMVILLEGYEPWSGTITIDGDVTTDVMVNEIPVPPTSLVADPNDADTAVDLTWNSPSGGGYTLFDFEFDDGGFTVNDATGWMWGTDPVGAHSGDNVWGTMLNSNYINSANWTMDTQPIQVYALDQLIFWHNYDTENYYDGGNVKISVDGGATWSLITPLEGYPEDAASTSNACIPGEPCYSDGPSGWVLATFDLAGYEGQLAQFRFSFGSDGSVNGYPGWFIDDVFIGNPNALPPERGMVRDVRFRRDDVSTLDRPVENYELYRLNFGDEDDEALWTTVGTTADTVYTDSGWDTVPTGVYRYAVKAIYTNNIYSNPSISNWIAKAMMGTATFNITTNVGSVGAGANVHMVSQTEDPEGNFPVYDGLANDQGVCFIDNIWMSDYNVFVMLEGHETWSGTLTVDGAETMDVTVNEVAVPPSQVIATQSPDDSQVDLIWNSPSGSGYTFWDFEATDGGFTSDNTTDGWMYGEDAAIGAQSGTHIWGTNLGANYPNSSNTALVSPDIMIYPMDQLTFWHYYDTENSWDGGNVKISTDGGQTWAIIFPEEGYPDDAASTANPAIPGEPCYTDGPSGWVVATFNLEDYEGQTVQFKWHFGADSIINSYPGWFIDDVRVGNPEVRDTDNANTRELVHRINRPTDRPVESYDIYRLNFGDEGDETLWTMVGNAVDTTYTDTGWDTVPTGVYRYAVKAVYTNNVYSNPAISNWCAKNMMGNLTVNITTNVGTVPAGAEVYLTAIAPDPNGDFPEYDTTANASGVATFNNVWQTDYQMVIVFEGFATWSGTVTVEANTTVDVMVTEIAVPCSHVTATQNPEGTVVNLEWWTPSGSGAQFYDFEIDDGGFVENDTAGWQWGTDAVGAQSGSNIWGTALNSNYINSANWWLDTPSMYVYSLDQLTFWHYYDTESYWDGGNVKVSTDNGATWTLITPEGDYPEDAASTGNAAIPGEPCFADGPSGWVEAVFDLSDYENQEVMFRFHFGTDGSVNSYPGWFIDDVRLGNPEVRGTENANTRTIALRPHRDGRPVIGYEIYRFLNADMGNENNWTMVGDTTSETDTTFTDTTWDALPQDIYRYAVKAIYTAGVPANPSYSNWLAKDYGANVTVNLTTNVGDVPVGAEITLQCLTPDPEGNLPVYVDYIGNDGSVVFPQVWLGDYDITADWNNFDPATEYNVPVYSDVTVNMMIIEQLNPPTNVQAALVNEGLEVEIQWDYPTGDRANASARSSVGARSGVNTSKTGLRNTDNAATRMITHRDRPDREVQHYTVYRLESDQEGNPGSWVFIDQVQNNEDMMCVDEDWAEAGIGQYKYAVIAVYTGELSSDPAFSNVLENDSSIPVVVNVSTNSGDFPTGALVTLTNQNGNPNFVYEETAQASGVIVFPGIWMGTYDVTCTLLGFEDFATVRVISSPTTINIQLIEALMPVEDLAYSIVPAGANAANVVLTWTDPTADRLLSQTRHEAVEQRDGEGASRQLLSYRIVRDGDVLDPNCNETTFTDYGVAFGTYTYSVVANYTTGQSPAEEISVEVTDAENGDAPEVTTALNGNYPNPFNPETTIRFALENPAPVTIEIYDVRGTRIRTLTRDQFAAGQHELVWNGKDENGRSVGSGIYFCRMRTSGYESTSRMVLLK